MLAKSQGGRFNRAKAVFPKNLPTPGIGKICTENALVVPQFRKCLGNTRAEVPVNFQSDIGILYPLVQYKTLQGLRKPSYRVLKRALGLDLI